MKDRITRAESHVGLLLANGHTKKEVAVRLNKSVGTVSRQTEDLYSKTGCRNLADLTREMITRYSGLNTHQILKQALKDIAIVTALVFGIWAAQNPTFMEAVKSSLINIF